MTLARTITECSKIVLPIIAAEQMGADRWHLTRPNRVHP